METKQIKLLKNLRAFKIKYIGATNSRGSRVSIKDLRNNKTLIIAYDYEFNNICDMANKYLNSIGIECLFRCEYENGYILLTNNFDVMIK